MKNVYQNIMKPNFFRVVFFTLLVLVWNPPAIAAEIRQDLLGDPAPPEAAVRTVMISRDTRYVHVEGGEIIRFVVADKIFGWDFNGPLSVSSFDLQRVAPAGVLDHEVRVIIAPNPRYMNP